MGVLRLVCGAEAHVAEDRARLLEPPWVRGWYQNVRLLEAVILGVERPLRGAASSQVTACRRFAPPRLRRGLWGRGGLGRDIFTPPDPAGGFAYREVGILLLPIRRPGISIFRRLP